MCKMNRNKRERESINTGIDVLLRENDLVGLKKNSLLALCLFLI